MSEQLPANASSTDKASYTGFQPVKRIVPETDDERDISDVAGDSSNKYILCYRQRQAGQWFHVHWIAFFFMTIWLFSRHLWETALLWLIAASSYGQGVAFAQKTWPQAFPSPVVWIVYLVPSVVASLAAYPLFFKRVKHLQMLADQQALNGEARSAFLRKQGNGSGWGLLLGIAVTAGIVWLSVYMDNHDVFASD